MTKSTPVPIDGRDVILRNKYRAIVAEYSSEIVDILQAVKYDTEADTTILVKCVRDLGRIDRFRLTGANQGAAIGRVFGRMRVGGHVIWATRFLEHVATSGGSGKGSSSSPTTTRYSYSVSLAIALCEGEITHVGRFWPMGWKCRATV